MLIEALFALFVAVTCALIYSASVPAANNCRAKADYSNVAVGLAQKELEALKSVDPNLDPSILASKGLIDSSTPIGTNEYSFTNCDSAYSDSPARVLPDGQGAITIELIDLELRRVTVVVTWTELGRERSVTVGTWVAKLNG